MTNDMMWWDVMWPEMTCFMKWHWHNIWHDMTYDVTLHDVTGKYMTCGMIWCNMQWFDITWYVTFHDLWHVMICGIKNCAICILHDKWIVMWHNIWHEIKLDYWHVDKIWHVPRHMTWNEMTYHVKKTKDVKLNYVI